MSAPTEPKTSKVSYLSVVALVIASLALTVSIGTHWVVWSASNSYPTRTPSSQAPTNDETASLPERPNQDKLEKAYKELDKLVAKGKATVRRWGRVRFGKNGNRHNMALAYLCLAKSSEAGRYYAASQVDEGQVYGIGPDGTRRGDPAKTAKAVCGSVPSWAK